MFKNVLLAAAILIASPAFVFSQDFFLSFDSTSLQTTDTQAAGTSGTAYIFSDGLFSFDALDLDITSSDSSVLLLTGGTAFNDEFSTLGGTAFDSSVVTVGDLDMDPNTDDSGNLFAVNVTQNGIKFNITPLGFNPHFDAGVGPNGAVLLASVDYSLVGNGSATLDLALGTQGILLLPGPVLNPTFGSATLTATPAAVPEPSSAVLLILGSVGLVARRKRA